jgi:hypothetical protein
MADNVIAEVGLIEVSKALLKRVLLKRIEITSLLIFEQLRFTPTPSVVPRNARETMVNA